MTVLFGIGKMLDEDEGNLPNLRERLKIDAMEGASSFEKVLRTHAGPTGE